MILIKNLLVRLEEKKEAKDFFPILLAIIIVSGLLLILATYLVKT